MKDVVEKMTREGNVTLEERVLELLSQDSPLKANEVALQLGVNVLRVRSAIKLQRKHFIDGKSRVRIMTGSRGYSLTQNRSNVVHETDLRIAQIAGSLYYGAPVFQKCRKIAAKDFNSIKLQYEPKMLELKRF
jgi:predicted ArsR family transcriptional regulator